MSLSTRQVLMALSVIGSFVGVAFLFVATPNNFNPVLEYLLFGLMLGACVYVYRHGHNKSDSDVEIQITRTAVLTLTLGVVIVSLLIIWENALYRRVSVVLLGACSLYFLLTKKEKSGETSVCAPPKFDRPAEPPPKQSPAGEGESSEPDWAAIANRLGDLGQEHRQQDLRVLRRIYSACKREISESATDRLRKVRWTVEQETQRLLQEAELEERAREDDVLAKLAKLVDWAGQKIPELAELDMSDLILAKTVADINRLKTSVSMVVVELNELKAIHNVDRETAIEKAAKRARAAGNALPLLQSNGMLLTEALIGANEELKPFESISGIQVVWLGAGQGYVTFEGNGRAWALKQAFGPDDGVKVEVRLFEFGEPSGDLARKVGRRVARVRKWKNVADEWPERISP